MLRWVAVVHAEQIPRFARWFSVLGRPRIVGLLEYCQYEYHADFPFVISADFPRVVCFTGMDGGTPGMWTILRQVLVEANASSEVALNSIEFTFTCQQ